MGTDGSGVGVLDKVVEVLGVLEAGPATLSGIAASAGLARATVHRVVTALEHHGLVRRDGEGRFVLGPRLAELGGAAGDDHLLVAGGPVLVALRDRTGESAQLFRRFGDRRICVAAAERDTGVRARIPPGSALTMAAGSAAQVLLAWEEPARLRRWLPGLRFTADTLAAVRRRGWARTVAERRPGLASVSAPVRAPSGQVVAAVSVAGPSHRFAAGPERNRDAVLSAAAHLTQALRTAPYY